MVAGSSFIESKEDVQTHLDRLKYAVDQGSSKINFVQDRHVDMGRTPRFTNRYTIAALFPDEDPVQAVRRELLTLTVEDYIETVKDLKYPSLPELLVFGKKYAPGDVYIKWRVQLMDISAGWSTILIISFHFSVRCFSCADFPYLNRGE